MALSIMQHLNYPLYIVIYMHALDPRHGPTMRMFLNPSLLYRLGPNEIKQLSRPRIEFYISFMGAHGKVSRTVKFDS